MSTCERPSQYSRTERQHSPVNKDPPSTVGRNANTHPVNKDPHTTVGRNANTHPVNKYPPSTVERKGRRRLAEKGEKRKKNKDRASETALMSILGVFCT